MAKDDRTKSIISALSLVTVREACDLLGMSQRLLFVFIEEGGLPVVMFGTRTMLLSSGLTDLLNRFRGRLR